MSTDGLTLSGSIKSQINLGKIADLIKADLQNALMEAEDAARRVFDEETPVDLKNLYRSVYTHRNQYAVWFGFAGILGGKPYGYAQEYGWHQNGGAFIEGKHFGLHAEQAAEAALGQWLRHGLPGFGDRVHAESYSSSGQTPLQGGGGATSMYGLP